MSLRNHAQTALLLLHKYFKTKNTFKCLRLNLLANFVCTQCARKINMGYQLKGRISFPIVCIFLLLSSGWKCFIVFIYPMCC